jgi:predicted Zn finger-like uncharacterized protein
MIITCDNCNKKFDLDSSMIPKKGRLLQCSSCDYKWFFKKKIIHQQVTPTKIDNPVDKINVIKKELDSIKIQTPKTIELLDNQIKDDFSTENSLVDRNENENRDVDFKINSSKEKKSYNILSLIILFIISFIALIIITDTFKGPIAKIVPNIEFLLYNLYETINDIKLFLTNLIYD